MLLLGLDLGTSAVKALLVDPAMLRVVAESDAPCTVSSPLPGWSEQAPSEWWDAACMATRAALEAAAKALGRSAIHVAERVAAVGVTGQMHGLVALDSACEVLRPCILWNDQRSADQCDALTERLGLARLLAWTGNRVHPGFTLPKLLWMREREPELFRRTRHVLLPKDWLRWRLCGALGQDVTDASGTSMFDPSRRGWSEEMLAAAQIDRAWLPTVHESHAIVGTVASDAAAATGLRPGTPVVAGAGDQAAAALGLGVIEEGACSATIGTSGVVFVARARHAPDEQGRLHAFCHAAPQRWHQMGVVLSAGGALRWFRDTLARDATTEGHALGVDAYAIIARRAAEAPAGCDGLTFLPYLAGERTPHADPLARGAFIGLTLGHDRTHVARAVLEGVTFALADCLDLVRQTIQDRRSGLATIRVTGGGARSSFWCQLCADVFECEVATLDSTAGGAMGAAMLAGVGSGVWADTASATRGLPQAAARYAPHPSAPLREAWHRYRLGYACVRGDRSATPSPASTSSTGAAAPAG